MFEAVHDVTARGIECFPASPRHEWVLQWPGMVVLVVTAVYWCVLLVLSCAVLCCDVFLYSPRVGPAVAWHGGAGGHGRLLVRPPCPFLCCAVSCRVFIFATSGSCSCLAWWCWWSQWGMENAPAGCGFIHCCHQGIWYWVPK